MHESFRDGKIGKEKMFVEIEKFLYIFKFFRKVRAQKFDRLWILHKSCKKNPHDFNKITIVYF